MIKTTDKYLNKEAKPIPISKPKTDEKSERAAWVKKTKNSPAARSGKFTAEERWQTHLKHRKWAANRGKKKRKPYGAMGRGQRR